MKSLQWTLLAALLLAAPGAAKERKPSVKAPKKQAAAPAQPQAAPAPAPAPGADRDVLTSAGFVLEQAPDGLRILQALSQSPADEMSESGAAFLRTPDGGVAPKTRLLSSGLREGDILLYLNGRRTETVPEAAKALREWVPGTRLSAVVSRSGSILGFSTRLPAPELPEPRDPAELTRREAALQEAHLAEANDPGRRPPLRAAAFRVGANERLWVRFPKGLPKSAAEDDVLEGEVSTPVSGDSNLDFIAVPAGSKVWAHVLVSREEDSVRFLKLQIYKIQPVGGHVYPVSALLTDASGDRGLLRVSAGGTIVAAPADDSPFIAGADRHFQAKLLKPFALYEPDAFYRAGPGLWFKTVPDGKSHAFEVTHVIPDRSAHKAGVKKGDRVYAVGGRNASNIDFSEGIALLYGAPGTSVELTIQRADTRRRERLELLRGVRYTTGWGISASSVEGGALVSSVAKGSPADKAGLREGVKLLRVDEKDLAGLSPKTLEAALAGSKTLTVQAEGGKPQKVGLSDASFPVPIPVPVKLEVVDLGKS